MVPRCVSLPLDNEHKQKAWKSWANGLDVQSLVRCFSPRDWEISTQVHQGVQPRYMGIAPIAAIPKVLTQFGLSKEDVDIYEV